jgi:hypothetical protein
MAAAEPGPHEALRQQEGGEEGRQHADADGQRKGPHGGGGQQEKHANGDQHGR